MKKRLTTIEEDKPITPKNEETKEIEQEITPKMEYGTLELTDELKESAKEAMTSRFNAVKSDREDKVKLYDDWEDLYIAGSGGKDNQTLAQVMTTDGYNSVEDWVAFIMDGMFPVDPNFEVKGRKAIIRPEQIEHITKVLNSNMKDTDYEDEFEDATRQGAKLGTLVSKKIWSIDKEPALRVITKNKLINNEEILDSENKPLTEQNLEQELEIEERPLYKFVNLRKLYFRPDKITWMIELIDSNWSEVERLANQDTPLYTNIKKAKKTKYPSGDEPDDEQKKASKSDTKDKSVQDIDNDVELMEGHHVPLMIPVDGNPNKKKRTLCTIVLANRAEVIRVQPSQDRTIPYLITKFFKKTGSEGLGLMELLEKQLREINTRRTQALDANTHGLRGMKAVNMKYIKKPEQLKIRPDGIIELKGTDKPIEQIIQFYRPPVEYANIAMALLDRIVNDIIRTTRMKGILAGEKVTPQPSASEWAGMMKEALKSVKLILKRIAKGQIEGWLEWAYIANVLNRQKSWMIPIEVKKETPGMPGMPPIEKTETQWIEKSPRDLYTNGIDIEVLGVAYMEDTIVARHQQMQKMDLLAKYGTLPLYNDMGQEVVPDFYKHLRKLLINFGDEKPDDGFRLKPAPPVMPGFPGLPSLGKPPIGAPGMPGVGAGAPNPADILRGITEGPMGGII